MSRQRRMRSKGQVDEYRRNAMCWVAVGCSQGHKSPCSIKLSHPRFASARSQMACLRMRHLRLPNGPSVASHDSAASSSQAWQADASPWRLSSLPQWSFHANAKSPALMRPIGLEVNFERVHVGAAHGSESIVPGGPVGRPVGAGRRMRCTQTLEGDFAATEAFGHHGVKHREVQRRPAGCMTN